MPHRRVQLAPPVLFTPLVADVANVHATQLFEFVGSISQSAADGETVRWPPTLMQLIAVDGAIDPAGPEPVRMDELARHISIANRDSRKVTSDARARNVGTEVNDQSLTPDTNPLLGPTRFGDWLTRSMPQGYATRQVVPIHL